MLTYEDVKEIAAAFNYGFDSDCKKIICSDLRLPVTINEDLVHVHIIGTAKATRAGLAWLFDHKAFERPDISRCPSSLYYRQSDNRFFS